MPAICATMSLDNSGSDLLTRLSNKVYEAARAGTMTLQGFPDFAPTIAALKEGSSGPPPPTYKVCQQQHDRLLILESMAGKWVSVEMLKDRAMEVIEQHNGTYNPNGSMWVEDRTGWTGLKCPGACFMFLCIPLVVYRRYNR